MCLRKKRLRYHIFQENDNSLFCLGVTSISAKMRIRDAATEWIKNRRSESEVRELEVRSESEVRELGVDVRDPELNLEPMVQPDEMSSNERVEGMDLTFVETTSRKGKVYHYFLNGYFKFKRKKVKPMEEHISIVQ